MPLKLLGMNRVKHWQSNGHLASTWHYRARAGTAGPGVRAMVVTNSSLSVSTKIDHSLGSFTLNRFLFFQ